MRGGHTGSASPLRIHPNAQILPSCIKGSKQLHDHCNLPCNNQSTKGKEGGKKLGELAAVQSQVANGAVPPCPSGLALPDETSQPHTRLMSPYLDPVGRLRLPVASLASPSPF